MKNLAIALAYHGGNFSGWQKQPGQRTVQGELERALERFYGEPAATIGSGRTDTGVHALGQVVSFTPPREYPAETVKNAIDSLLPPDIRLLNAKLVEDFHARYDAQRRGYRYLFHEGDDLFLRGRVLLLKEQHNWEAMAQAAERFAGERDFAAIGGAVNPGGSTIREVFSCKLQREGRLWLLDIIANAFLYRMVRTIVGCLSQVGRSRMTSEGIDELLNSRNRNAAPAVAPPHGLYLYRIEYPNFSYSPEHGPL